MDDQKLNPDLYELSLNGANDTIREIAQQPLCWKQIPALLDKQNPALYRLIAEQLDHRDAVITFCGAGTSAYIGQILAATVQRFAKARVRAVATTDIVSRPDNYFSADSQGIVFAFGRSGNSPESIDTAEKVTQLAPNVEQINVTCNPNGELSQRQDGHVCLMPPPTHDSSFVMTSSFSTMLLFTYRLIARAAGQPSADLGPVIDCAERWCRQLLIHPAIASATGASRLVYLGSNTLYGAAREAALKALEMTAGQVVTLAETSLGFRHGPKSIVDNHTTVCLFVSNNAYTQRFDRDMVIELLENHQAKQIVAVANQKVCAELSAKYPDNELLHFITLPGNLDNVDDVLLAPLFVLVSQIIALSLAIRHDISPDNPCPTGEVNRVVQGVTLYEFKGAL
ncbi:MAG: sugar isomerase [Gammaproteobacteria bacterium]|nr:MAG: sugar isomerase [Gammaproteobacteria bacterium]